MPEIKWTPDQERAIKACGGDVVVAAGAGAGKTAVLTARVLRHVQAGVPIDRLLVITFTESAAQELKTRIAEELRVLAAGQGGAQLRLQSLLLGRSWISTIHAFCLRVLKEHALAAGLSMGARVQQADEADLLAEEVAYEVAAELLARDARVQTLVDQYCDGNVQDLVRFIRMTAALVDSIPDGDAWLAEQRARTAAGELPAAEFHAHLGSEVERAVGHAREVEDLVRKMHGELEKYADYAKKAADTLAAIRTRCRDFGSLLGAVSAFAFERLPSPRLKEATAQEKEAAAELVKEMREAVVKGIVEKLSRQTEAQYREGERIVAAPGAALLDAVTRFREETRRRRAALDLLSFNDLEHRALAVLGGEEKVAENVAERVRAHFAEVLVDEFQDVNPVQDRLLGTVARGNLFCVGDLKQSIYRFRLGDPGIFLGRIGNVRGADPGRFVPLRENFRCRAGLIAVINGVFEYLMTDALDGIGFDEAAHLRAGRQEPVADSTFGPPFVSAHILSADAGDEADEEGGDDLERAEKEARVIARELVRLRHQGLRVGRESRPVAWSDCAVLLRAVKGRVGVYTRVFGEAGIPVVGPSSGDPMEQIELRDLSALVNVLDNPRQDIPLAAFMRSPFGGFSIEELAAVRTGGGDAEPFHVLVLDHEAEDPALGARLVELRERLRLWRRYARELPLGEALTRILAESGYFAYVAGLPRAARRRAHITAFLERARQFAAFADQSLRRFVHFLQELEERERDIGVAALEEGGEDAVHILSIHQSKGLEWPVVVAADMGRRFNLRDLAARVVCDRTLGVGLRAPDVAAGIHYPTASHLLICARKKRELLAEELRLLYVAFTRARERLVLVGSGNVAALRVHFDHPDTGGHIPEHALVRANSPLVWVCRALGRMAAEADTGGAGLLAVEFLDRVPPCERADEAVAPAAAPSPDLAGEKLQRILLHRYPYERDTATRAAMPVTELGARARSVAAAGPGRGTAPRESALPEPEFMRRREALEGRERGLLTHLFLRHMDLRARDPAEEFVRLAERGVFQAAQRDGIDFATLQWFLQTPEGRRLASAPERVRREVPFFARLGAGTVPVLLRGQVDAVRCGDDGLEILDFKTDRVAAGAVAARAEAYAPQLLAYSWALQGIWKRPVVAAAFVFLACRQVVTVPDCTLPAGELASRLEALVASQEAPAAGAREA